MVALTLGKTTTRRLQTLQPLKQEPFTRAPIILKSKKIDRSISAQLKRRKKLPKVLQVVTSPVLTGVLAGTLTTLLTRSPKAGVKAFLGTEALIGGTAFLGTSPKAKKFVVEKFTKPAEFGVGAGLLIESGLETGKDILGKAKDVIKIPKIPDPVKKAGIVAGVGAGLVTAGALAIPKIKSLIPKSKTIATSPVGAVIPAGLVTPQGAFQPLGAVEQPVEEVPVIVEKPAQKPVTIKNTFNPSIDISFKKSKKFINQQINIK